MEGNGGRRKRAAIKLSVTVKATWFRRFPSIWGGKLGNWRSFLGLGHSGISATMPTLFPTPQKNRIDSAMKDGILEDGQYPETEVCVVGCFRGVPHFARAKFLPWREPEIQPYDFDDEEHVYPGWCDASGSMAVNQLIRHGDPQFTKICKLPEEETTLPEAVEFVKGYIEACKLPKALELDSGCDGIGGHTHVVTLMPNSGFEWVISPIPDSRRFVGRR
jgi:hypothetical protein